MTNKQEYEEALKNLTNEDVKIRKQAINNLEGIKDETAIGPLIKAATDENTQVRFKAAEILGTLGTAAVDKLITQFQKEEGQKKRYIVYALKQTKDDKVIPYLVEATEDEDPIVRKVAIRGLGEIVANDNIDDIAKGLEDEDWGVRLAAVHALGDLETEEGIKLIKKARRKEKDKDFKKSCNKSIKKAETNIAKIRFNILKEKNIMDTDIKELGKTAKQQEKALVKFMKDYTDKFVEGTVIYKEE